MMITERYPDLIGAKDGNKMTALQHLASNPTVFQSRSKLGFLKGLIYHCIIHLIPSSSIYIPFIDLFFYPFRRKLMLFFFFVRYMYRNHINNCFRCPKQDKDHGRGSKMRYVHGLGTYRVACSSRSPLLIVLSMKV